MARREDGSPRPEMVQLAKAIHRALKSFEAAQPNRAAKIDSSLSRILRVDPGWKPRRADPDAGQRPAKEPSIFTIKEIAQRLGTTVGALLGERGYDVTEDDRQRMADFAGWLSSRFDVTGVGKLPTSVTPVEENVLEFVPFRSKEQPKEMNADELRRVAEALGDVIEFRKGALWKEYEVPLVATVSAGSGIEIFETYEKVRQIPEYYWNAGARAVFKVRGHSMLDMGITDNDLLFVVPDVKPKTGDVVICSLNGAAFVKEFERTKDGVRLLSHNPEYQPMTVGEQDDLRVFGVVVGRTGDLMGGRGKKGRG